MALRPEIALGYKQPDIINPAQLLSLKQMQGQSNLQEMQIEDAMRQRQERDQLKSLFQDPSNLDQSGMVSLQGIQKAYGVNPTVGASLAKDRQVSLKSAAELAKLEVENKAKTAQFFRDGLAAANDEPSYQQWLSTARAAGLPAAKTAPDVFDPKWKMSAVLDATKFIEQHTPKFELVDVGGEKISIDVNPNTNPAIKGTKLAKTMSPAERATDARARAEATSTQAVRTNTQENQMRDDFTRASVEFVKVRDAHQRVIESAADPSAAGDLALIFNYMKVLDPGSTVREGEFATAQNAGGVDQRAVALYNRVLKGERLSPEQRADFVDRSGRLYKGAVGNQEEIEKDYEAKAKGAGVRPEQVITKHRVKEKAKKKDEPKNDPLTPDEEAELKALRARFNRGG
jgi:hypothetical protein